MARTGERARENSSCVLSTRYLSDTAQGTTAYALATMLICILQRTKQALRVNGLTQGDRAELGFDQTHPSGALRCILRTVHTLIHTLIRSFCNRSRPSLSWGCSLQASKCWDLSAHLNSPRRCPCLGRTTTRLYLVGFEHGYLFRTNLQIMPHSTVLSWYGRFGYYFHNE